MTQEEVLSEVARLSPTGGLVEITGGEPMLQEREVIPLMEQMLDATIRYCLRPAASARWRAFRSK
jgi:organic radical activating enzyme